MTTHQSAVVLIPPPEVWGPVQAIRCVHDSQFRRWMPHITILYPFLPPAELPGAIAPAEKTLQDVEPFRVILSRFSFFRHERGTYINWLAPEPRGPLVAVYNSLVRLFPECDTTARFPGGFTPHLTVGQSSGEEQLCAFEREMEPWMPLTFTAQRLTIVVCESPPDDVFRPFAELPIGARTLAR